jgi:hypothetical protein
MIVGERFTGIAVLHIDWPFAPVPHFRDVVIATIIANLKFGHWDQITTALSQRHHDP